MGVFTIKTSTGGYDNKGELFNTQWLGFSVLVRDGGDGHRPAIVLISRGLLAVLLEGRRHQVRKKLSQTLQRNVMSPQLHHQQGLFNKT